ncbi:hypothetical protein J3R82DRAFT_8346 [Butyriboletus roseoflavus]|nr:hypothetical protein J3R82DRAFT_8346 [Butyriboletus roseoflavus]
MTSFEGGYFNNISWPSLYSPATEVGFFGPAVRPGGYYLSDPDGTSNLFQHVFKFTLYWTLIFHLPFNFIAGIYAFFNFLFPPARSVGDTIILVSPAARSRSHPPTHLHLHSHSHSQSQSYSPPPVDEWLKPPRVNARRSRWTFALLVFFTFLGFSLLSAVVGAAVLAFVLVGVYRAGGFYISTYVPPPFLPFSHFRRHANFV